MRISDWSSDVCSSDLAGLATMCVGNIVSADQANTIVAAGRADLVALARPHLVDPAFLMRAAAFYGVRDVHCPPQYRAGLYQLHRSAARERERLLDLPPQAATESPRPARPGAATVQGAKKRRGAGRKE